MVKPQPAAELSDSVVYFVDFPAGGVLPVDVWSPRGALMDAACAVT